MLDNKSPKSKENHTGNAASTVEASTRPRGIIANATWNSSFTIWTIVISFVLTPIMIKYLGVPDYGVLLLVWSVTGVMGTMNLGLGEGTLRYVARHYGERSIEGINRVFGATLSLFYSLCAVISVLIFLTAPALVHWLNIPPEQQELVSWLLIISALAVSLSIVQSLFGTIPSALQRYDISIKISMVGSVVRTCGYIALVVSGYGVLYIVIWDLIVSFLMLFVVMKVAHRLLPSLRMLPQFSFAGLFEIAEYSISSFLTFLFHKLHRESGKLLLARFFGPTPVVYLATPDNIAQRFHEVVASGVETTLPRFSSDQDTSSTEALFWNATWAGLSLSLILFVPFFVLIQDFLALWINLEFALHSALIGQLLALYLISQGAFAAPAAYFRGIGKPWFVTGVILLSLLITFFSSLIFIPAHGPVGAAYAYLAGSAAPFAGTVLGSVYAFGWLSFPRILRTILIPLLAGVLSAYAGYWIRDLFEDLSWFGLIGNGLAILVVSSVLVVGSDWLLGGSNTPSRILFQRLAGSRKVGFLFRGRRN
jgi:O-antigen/teichoic acid export membrane protein